MNEVSVSQLQTEETLHWQDLPQYHCSLQIGEKCHPIFSSVQQLLTLPCILFSQQPQQHVAAKSAK